MLFLKRGGAGNRAVGSRFDEPALPKDYEFKYSETPTITKSMRIALKDLQLDQLRIVCPGSGRAQLDEKIAVVGLMNLVGTNTATG